MFAGSDAPGGWLLCDGQILSRRQFADLFAAIGDKFGGDGSTTFAIPDLRGRVPVQFGATMLGGAGGLERVALTVDHLPPHFHRLRASEADGDRASFAQAVWAHSEALSFSADPPSASMNPAALAPAGGSVPHENMMPFLAINFIIATEGLTPL